MIREIQSGRVTELVKFLVAPNVIPRKGRMRGVSTARKQDANERSSERRLARLINCNFVHGDLWLTPNYSPEGYSKLIKKMIDADDMDALRRQAEREIELFLRRLKRQLEKLDIQLKYIAVTSDMDGETGEAVRIHHHILIPAAGVTMKDGELYIADKKMSKIWGFGSIDYRPLRDQDDYTPIASYLMRQVRRLPDARKYKPSRNLAKPVLVREVIVYRGSELKIPKGAKLLHRNEYEPGMPQYVRFVKPVKSVSKGRRKDKDDS